MNGVFVMDLVAAHPIHDPVQWAIHYYLMRPALTIMFYPPLFYAVEAVAFATFGVSHFVAQFAVFLFVVLLAASVYSLARLVLPRWSAVGAALLVIGTPETAFWGRQVMLDVPAYALIAATACCLAWHLRTGRRVAIYLTAALLLASVYTKYNAAFVAPALAAAFVIAKGKAALHDRHALMAAALVAIGLLPAVLIILKFGARNLESVSGLQGTLPLVAPGSWPGSLGVWPVAGLADRGIPVLHVDQPEGATRYDHSVAAASGGGAAVFAGGASTRPGRAGRPGAGRRRVALYIAVLSGGSVERLPGHRGVSGAQRAARRRGAVCRLS
jgi:4-amino-4-deoxy-L-arabinose transferase-like glycosyltransferase